MLLDLRYAIRAMRRAKGFTAAAVATIALGTGATAAVFAVVNAVLVRPLPYRDPSRLALVWSVDPHGSRTWLSPPELEDLGRRATTLESVAGLSDLRLNLTGDGAPEELQVVAASASFFPMLGVTAAAGRLLAVEDDREQSPRVAVLSHALWQRRFGGAPSAVGATIHLDGRAYTVVGVLPASFSLIPPSSVFPAHADVWVALRNHLPFAGRDVRYLHAVARVREGATMASAAGEVNAIGAAVSREYASAYAGGGWSFALVRMQDDLVRGVRPALLTLFGVVSLVLAIACVNVAALMLARGAARRRELTVRAALGASRLRLARQLLTEGFVLAVCGGAGGLLLASFAPALARVPALAGLPRFDEVTLDWRVLSFTAVAALATAFAFALAPLVGRGRVSAAVPSGVRSTATTATGRWLAGAEIALATLALVVALLLASRFARMLDVNPGFASGGVAAMRVSLAPAYRDAAAMTRYYDAAIEAARHVAGVVSAAAVTQLPLSGAQLGSTFLAVPAREGGAEVRVDADLRGITPDYPVAMRMPVVAGRPFTTADRADAPAVALVDELLAARLAASGPVIGRRIRWIRRPERAIEVVGIVGAVRHRGVEEEARATVYLPYTQYARSTMFIVARTAAAPAAASTARAVAAAVGRIDPAQPVADVQTLEDLRARSLARPGFGAALGGVLAALALAMTAVGVFGLFAYAVAQRRRELGIRLALGATPHAVLAMVLSDAARLSAGGVCTGIGAGIVAARVIRALLPGPFAPDALVLATAAVVSLASALAACWSPARRAAAVDPADVLRADA